MIEALIGLDPGCEQDLVSSDQPVQRRLTELHVMQSGMLLGNGKAGHIKQRQNLSVRKFGENSEKAQAFEVLNLGRLGQRSLFRKLVLEAWLGTKNGLIPILHTLEVCRSQNDFADARRRQLV